MLFHQQRSTTSRPVVSGPPPAELDEAYTSHRLFGLWQTNRRVYGEENYGTPPTGQAGPSAVTRCNA